MLDAAHWAALMLAAMPSPDPALQALLARAADARRGGRAAEELRCLDEAVARAPGSPLALNARGMRALADRAFPVAVDCFTRAVAADAHEPALWLNLATACREGGDDDGELRALGEVLMIDQAHLVARVRLAESFGRQGRLSDAAPQWSAVVQLASATPDPSPAVAALLVRARALLAEHNAAFARALEDELGGAAATGDAAHRFRACVGHMLGTRPVFRNECAGVYYPFLPADEFFDRRHFGWFGALEAQTDAIRREALALLGDPGEAVRPYVRLDAGTPANKWSALDQSLNWGAAFLWEYGVRNDPVCLRCPATAAALAQVPQSHLPGKAPSAFFSVLQPGARIPPHTGVSNTRAIIHLPLVVPPGCGFRVGGETREWREGEAFAFDDTIEHEAWNTSDSLRIVLIFDVWNPHLTVEEQGYLTKLFTVADRGLVSPKAG